ncbi:sigma-70 family RNA polymerase sigma factor [Pseudoalteromonas sp. S16_S37]|uniref:sigma-70 family RNA polymerase sigma factor n=1 Tax=Pseudoalteromonas sp. S16_S37 TaxID=2720228 RepID=UPI0016811AAE|nr:sigma-70 family RNA polymerase sigma factor [Pseudoalteromonas sp. S16_S37]MBD1583259.1 sigma-70 family RNA polymerase sigma factor [Pseudoalteromonas sp. S16_S37]
MRSDLVDKTIKDLIGDFERTEERIAQTQLTRIFLQRGLTADESAIVIETLISLDVPVEWAEIDETNDQKGSTVAAELSGFRFIDNYDLLSKEEEIKLGRAIQLGIRVAEENLNSSEHANTILENGKNAKQVMMLANLRLVRKVASFFTVHAELTIEDLFQEGVIGLSKAVDKFDPNLGYKFSTYAVWWIRQAIERSIIDKGLTIRVPVHMHKKILQYRKAVACLSALNYGKTPSPKEVAEELNWDVADVQFCWAISSMQPSSLDESKAEGGQSLKDILVAEIPSPEEVMNTQQLVSGLKKHLSILKEKEIEVLKYRFGLTESQDEETLECIGKKFGVTRERIRQIEAEALKKLRRPSSASVLKNNFLDDL